MENTKKHTILVVEDESVMLQTLRDNLVSNGFNVLQAKDGAEGLTVASAHHPDLILLDILMPGMDGLEMMQKLRAQDAWGKKVPIIILTNLSPEEDKIINRIAEDEPAYYLVKTDWNISNVIERIKERLSRIEG
jgi:two-component system alkaline phosphatase synthesis response regulator PhoP